MLNRTSHRTLLRLGMAFLLAFNLLHWLARPSTTAWQDIFDGAQGLLAGVAIGLLLLYLKRRMDEGDESCA